MPNRRPGRFASFLSELKRRRVVRVAAIYLVIAFAALQAVDVLAPALHLPEWTTTLFVVIALAGFVVAAGLAWAFDVVPDGQPRPADGGDGEERAVVNAARAGGRTPGDMPCIAVIPFLNLSSDPENEYFADGVTEDVIASLSKISALRVISRTSVMPFKKRGQSLQEIAAALGATTILDGSVRRSGDRVRIVAELIDAATDRHLWAETYDRQLPDIFAIQSDVAVRIAAALRAELSLDEQTRIRQQPTGSMEAYELYLKGRHLMIRFTPAGIERAIRFFEQALAVDESYALAHASIAIAYTELSDGGIIGADVARPRATSAAARALRLDPGLSEAHTAAGYIKSLWEFDWSGAEVEFRTAIDLSPSNADAYDFYGRLCGAMGRFDEAVELVRRAQQLDPLAHRTDLANALLRAGRYDEAVAEATRAVEFESGNDRAHATLGWAYLKQGRTAEGLAELERAVALAPDTLQWSAQLGQARALAGDAAGARAILRQLEQRAASEFVSPYHLAFVHTGLGEHDRAIELLERAVAEGTGSVHGIRGSFLFATLRGHPRFQALIERISAPAAGLSTRAH
ncbi:MAG TPA: tetratricopeptide repeat protein [Longimicrobiales bacterium]